jgi:hypothetical protein
VHVPIIEGDGVRLRGWLAGDAGSVQAIHDDPVVAHLGLSVVRLDVELDNAASVTVARALGAQPGEVHVDVDRHGVERTLRCWRLPRSGPAPG